MSSLLRYVLGIAVPPVGIFLTYGVGSQLFINLGLCLLGWVPGIIHALWAIPKFTDDDTLTI